MLPFRCQILEHLLAALLAGFLLSIAFGHSASEIESKSARFTTQSGMLVVTFELHRQAPPKILDVQPLEKGRVSVVQPGDYVLVLEDDAGQAQYLLPFRAVFTLPGAPLEPVDEVRMIYVVPNSREVAHVTINSPHGSATFDLAR